MLKDLAKTIYVPRILEFPLVVFMRLRTMFQCLVYYNDIKNNLNTKLLVIYGLTSIV